MRSWHTPGYLALAGLTTFVLLAVPALAQTLQTSAVLTGHSVIKGTAQVITSPPQQTTHIYIYSPPLKGSSGQNNANLMTTNVMGQTAIDGVTVNINWNAVETTTDPTAAPCGGANSDTLQEDSAHYCHTYLWTNVDGMACVGAGGGTALGQFFCGMNSWGQKKVNPLIIGITQNINAATPDYLWHTGMAWNMAVGTQDVVNNIKDSLCAGYFGYTSPAISAVTVNGVSHIATVSLNSNSFAMNDKLWTTGFMPTDLNVTGGTVSTGSSTGFTYGCGTCSTVTHIGSAISSQSSFPLPTELPYKTAFRAFIAAAVYHFAHGNSVIIPSQVAYMRVGHAYGAEAYPACQAQWPQDTSIDSWVNFYSEMNGYLMGITNAAEQQIGSPIFHMQTSINSGATPMSPDLGYADAEAQSSVQFTGGDLMRFGFGTQGLQASDYSMSGCTTGTADWCKWFNQFWLGGPAYTSTDFELQQIDCSNPTGTNDGGLSTCFLGTSGTGKTGDLRTLLSWIATTQHATILELYAQDALLAYDPNFCDVNVNTCNTGSGTTTGDTFGGLDPGTQNKFYTSVGQGSGCGSGTGLGDCSYAAAVNATHGMH